MSNFFGGEFFGGGFFGAITPSQSVESSPSGVSKRRKRELIVNLHDVLDRESTADFLKRELRARHQIAVEPLPARPAQKMGKALEAIRNMEIERAQEKRRALDAENNNIIAAILLIG